MLHTEAVIAADLSKSEVSYMLLLATVPSNTLYVSACVVGMLQIGCGC